MNVSFAHTLSHSITNELDASNDSPHATYTLHICMLMLMVIKFHIFRLHRACYTQAPFAVFFSSSVKTRDFTLESRCTRIKHFKMYGCNQSGISLYRHALNNKCEHC